MSTFKVSLFLATYLAVGAGFFAQGQNQTGAGSSQGEDDYLLRGGSVVGRIPGVYQPGSVLDREGLATRRSVPYYRKTRASRAGFNSITSFTAPKKAKISLEKALNELNKGPRSNVDKVIDELENAVAIYPSYALAWSILGQVRMETGNAVDGEVDLLKAIEIDPKYIRPYEPLIRLRMSQNNWEQVEELSDYVLAIAPEPAILWYKALVRFQAGQHDEAISFIDKAQRAEDADEQFPQTHQVLGVIYAGRNQYREAAAEYRRYLELAPHAESREAIQKQLDEWKQLGLI